MSGLGSHQEQEQTASSSHVIPPPSSTVEAYLLLEAARADRQVCLTRKTLALQIIHRNTLTLQYNRLLLEKVQDELSTADQFIGHVWLTIRKSGHPVAFEYAMREDYSHHMESSPHDTSSYVPSSVLDVELD
ncbi:hypothetical protein PAXINDRAFT_101542 [Paxillus involutus ATCC 200175]|uniref:Uncharacterized protein n=1 Tax=Paxillus involutus ATCC 200175 TaxID=664439 RepID=A0A0C9TWR9_PAXIN|nr:hypothetical protein PAXINDRAFT_101542 [Paxillus involutus ATCC 200175]